MRILVASDIHGRLSRMKMLDEKIRAFQPDKIFLLGDFLYHGPRNGVPEDYDPMAVGEILKSHKDKIIAVRGNCDARIDEDILSFPLEDNRRFALGGYWFDLYHGDEFSLENLKPEIGDILISGHTHIQILEKKDGSFIVALISSVDDILIDRYDHITVAREIFTKVFITQV